MTKEEAKAIVVAFFEDTTKKGVDGFLITPEYKEAEKVLGGRLSPEMKAIYEEVSNSFKN